MTIDFVVPPIPSHGGWGPIPASDDDPSNSSQLSPFAGLPYAPYARSDRLGRISADFTTSGNVSWRNNNRDQNDRRNRHGRDGDGDDAQDANEAFTYRLDDGSGDRGGGFVLV
eukprot:CAMPEP_0113321330 /NCGR_PEP_ID=MMETSP0010_2-20120614/14854_1 /TAXON_ID=216773 ORGANISM="Corethron hystrix, Strain 308" /NCGR_SAMPLE_ID=MMETSP0010_2 /ASSEMBLY_ACC=CAM_ASM_000155 /LENGTH=112 /DNA_ID=CAMNT_0000179435 /DNA_START=17 /DNA_END=352 /DNA_ORIENTATION=+ /assembly_acc=CAM_ASM_000155